MYLTEEIMANYATQVERLTSELHLRDPIPAPFTVREAYAADLWDAANSRRNIIGFGYGEKLVGGTPQGVLAIGVYVVRKAPPADVHPSFLAENLVQELLGRQYLSDVIEVGRPRLLHHAGRRYPYRIPGGAAISDSTGGASGTLGGWVIDENDKLYLLSCWHCIDGDQGGNPGKDVLQPPGGSSIATIEVSIDPRSCPQGKTTIDASLAKVDDLKRVGDFILRLGEIRGWQPVRTTYLKVRKFGVTTHLTTGGIVQLGANMKLQVPSVGQNISWMYEKQLLIQPNPTVGPFAASGDSGSLIITDDNEVVGLLVGGEDAPPNYIATPITDVLNSLWASRTGSLKFLTYP